MSAPIITYQVAHRAAWDAGNRSAARNGREAWNLVDMAVAVNDGFAVRAAKRAYELADAMMAERDKVAP